VRSPEGDVQSSNSGWPLASVMLQSIRSPIVIGRSGATVFRVTREDGVQWIEKSDAVSDISVEAAVLRWCAGRLPVPEVLAVETGVLSMSAVPGVTLIEVEIDCAVALTAEALHLIHSIPIEGCPFRADWATRLCQAEHRDRRCRSLSCRSRPSSPGLGVRFAEHA
jgi:aminoglycoside phosphotransferase